MINIALLIPTTSRGRSYASVKNTPFFSTLLPSLISNLTKTEIEKYHFGFFLGYGDEDQFYCHPVIQSQIRSEFQFQTQHINCKLIDIVCPLSAHNPVKVWNELFKVSYNLNYDYFYQLGDDIQFLSPNWVEEFVTLLGDNIGVVGPNDTNPVKPMNLMTQSFTNRKHMEIFDYYYPHAFTNWHSDNWIQQVYGDRAKVLEHIKIVNTGGSPRYHIDNKSSILSNEVSIGKDLITQYCNKQLI